MKGNQACANLNGWSSTYEPTIIILNHLKSELQKAWYLNVSGIQIVDTHCIYFLVLVGHVSSFLKLLHEILVNLSSKNELVRRLKIHFTKWSIWDTKLDRLIVKLYMKMNLSTQYSHNTT